MSSRASARIAFFKSGIDWDSSSEWALVRGSSTPVTTTWAPGKIRWKSAMKGMEPPTPMLTLGVPHASVRHSWSREDTGESMSAWKPLPPSFFCTSTRAPKGAWARRWAASLSSASSGSAPGTVRSDSRKRVCGEIVFEASRTLRASKPMTVIDGFVHTRAARSPVPARRTPSTTPAAARKSASSHTTSASSHPPSPSTATEPSASKREEMSMEETTTESRSGPPKAPEWTAWSATVTSTVAMALPRRVEVTAGSPAFQLLESATTMTSAANSSRWASRKAVNDGDPISSSPST